MSEAFQPTLNFEAADRAVEMGEALVLELDGYEGPLHLLLALARRQRVDLLTISIAELAEQYLEFVQTAREQRLALAGEYLVMAAWLTLLKSQLLLPKPKRQEPNPPAEVLAHALSLRLAKLAAMREAVGALQARAKTGVDVFTRSACEARVVELTSPAAGDLFQLVRAYVAQRSRKSPAPYQPGPRIEAYPLEDARRHLRYHLSALTNWTPLEEVTPPAAHAGGPTRASYAASTFCAALELVKESALETHQARAFSALYLKARTPAASEVTSTDGPATLDSLHQAA